MGEGAALAQGHQSACACDGDAQPGTGADQSADPVEPPAQSRRANRCMFALHRKRGGPNGRRLVLIVK